MRNFPSCDKDFCLSLWSAAKQTMKKQTAEVEALTSKLADMETLVSSKDVEIRDMKKFVEGLKGTFSGKIQVKIKTIYWI